MKSTIHKIGLVGYGRMGKEIAIQLAERGHEIAFIVDPSSKEASASHLTKLGAKTSHADVVIDFSLSEAVLEHARFYVANNISVIVGTTGWDIQKNEVFNTVKKNSQVSYLYGSNFSIGAQIFMRTAEVLAEMLDKVEEYDVGLWESHHTKKKDSPSGTAKRTAERVLSKIARKTELVYHVPHNEVLDPSQLPIISQRVGQEPGYHEFQADSVFDTISLSHRARNRSGFALGAVLAAEWVSTGLKNNSQDVLGIIAFDDFIKKWFHWE